MSTAFLRERRCDGGDLFRWDHATNLEKRFCASHNAIEENCAGEYTSPLSRGSDGLLSCDGVKICHGKGLPRKKGVTEKVCHGGSAAAAGQCSWIAFD